MGTDTLIPHRISGGKAIHLNLKDKTFNDPLIHIAN